MTTTRMLVAAAMDPLGLMLMRAHTHYSAGELVVVISSPVMAALVAQQISKVVHHLTEGIVKAREVGSYKLVERLGAWPRFGAPITACCAGPRP